MTALWPRRLRRLGRRMCLVLFSGDGMVIRDGPQPPILGEPEKNSSQRLLLPMRTWLCTVTIWAGPTLLGS